MIVSPRTLTSVWKWPKCSSVRGEVQSMDTRQGTALLLLPATFPVPRSSQGFCPCPPRHTTVTHVFLGSPHHTVLSSGPISLAWLHLLEDRIYSCLFSQKFVECLVCAGCGNYRGM